MRNKTFQRRGGKGRGNSHRQSGNKPNSTGKPDEQKGLSAMREWKTTKTVARARRKDKPDSDYDMSDSVFQ